MSATPERTVDLHLIVEPGRGPVAGVLDTGRERFEFTGWIELTALIEGRRQLSDPEATRAAPPPALSGS